MGAWGEKPFENDDALDFMNKLEARPTWAVVRERFEETLEVKDYLEAPDGSEAVAAAALVASNLGNGNFLPEEFKDFPRRMGPMPKELASLAHEALVRVSGEDSELNELWHEDQDENLDENGGWLQTLIDIQTVLDKAK